MSLKKMIESYKKTYGGSEKEMWEAVDLIDERLLCVMKEECPDEYYQFMRELAEIYNHGHYDREYAEYDISKMWYKTPDGVMHKGGKWTIEEIVPIYNKHKTVLTKPYNVYDYAVTANMIYTDQIVILKSWFPSDTEEQINDKIFQLVDNWLNDPDYAEEGDKIWDYFC